jgi:uncharacterized repeat protein (TIGR01451 family)
MSGLFSVLLRVLALAVLLTGAAGARADTELGLWKSFDGRVNFTGTQVSVRSGSNTSAPCTIYAPSTIRSAKLTVPYGATVLSAQLYWAGSGASDYTVTFEGKEITATRTFTSTTVGNGFNYFGGAADVTAIVKPKGSGDYGFSGLTVANGSPWCGSQGVLGGFSLLVVYSLPSEPERVLNLYEGFRYVQNGEVVVNASNFRWNRTATPIQEKARIGHITWEGDPTLLRDGEQLIFEGTEMTDNLNPVGNQFNSSSNINNSDSSYGIDFDAYDTSVTISSWDDAVVTTRYKSGQDMVILNAEILVVPTLPVSDLAISIVRAGALKVGADVQYKVTVTNNGPYTESGAITVTNTLPAGMYYTSGIVTGWSCSATTTAGTCTYRGGLAPGASAPVLTVYTRVTTTGQKVNTVKVTGTTTDDDLANNTASDTGLATYPDGTVDTPPPPPKYIFTDSVCKPNIAIGVSGQSCKKYATATVGGKAASIYITATNDKGVPVAASDKADLTPSMEFMLVCNNPDTGSVGASYAGAAIPACVNAKPVWSPAVTIKFPKGTVSLAQSFVYNDVGKVMLSLRESGASESTDVFVSAPAQVGFRRISYGGYDNPGANTGAGTGFAPAGAFVTVEAGALLDDKKTFAPNFGNETPRAKINLDRSKITGVELLDAGILTESEKYSWNKGIVTTQAAWSEVGAINFDLDLTDPDGSNDAALAKRYFGVVVPGSTATVGRFYPAYFKTETAGPFDCPPRLPTAYYCPRGTLGAVYSKQPFGVAVYAYNDANVRVNNFGGEWSRPVTLSAVGPNGAAALATQFTPQAGTTSTVIAKATELRNSDGSLKAYELTYRPSYALAYAYDNGSPRGTTVSNPTGVYVRAVASETTVAGAVQVTSLRTGGGEVEQGVLVLSGRLKLANALGSDLLRTPLQARAEYWAGATAGWLFNPGFADALGGGVTDNEVTDPGCSPNFFGNGETCPPLVRADVNRVVMRAGAGVLWMRAPGKRPGGGTRSGSMTLRYGGWTWLPSTTGRISFGSPRSPVIYVREMYY